MLKDKGLKYLFIAEFKTDELHAEKDVVITRDGKDISMHLEGDIRLKKRLYKQTPQDRSKIWPDFKPEESDPTSGLSEFSDISSNTDKLISFTLKGAHNKYTVSLIDGHFEINDAPFLLSDYSIPLTNFKLIYYRTIDQSTDVDVTIGEDLKPIVSNLRNKRSITFYKLGWEAIDPNGKRIEKFILIP